MFVAVLEALFLISQLQILISWVSPSFSRWSTVGDRALMHVTYFEVHVLHESTNSVFALIATFFVKYTWRPVTLDHNKVLVYFYLWLTGVGGNLVAVQASRLSTSLHLKSQPGVLPEDAVHGCPSPVHVFFNKGRSLQLPFVAAFTLSEKLITCVYSIQVNFFDVKPV